MLNSIRAIESVRCTEVVRFSECPLSEVPLYSTSWFVRLDLFEDSLINCYCISVWVMLS